jgi:hypothetical protein
MEESSTQLKRKVAYTISEATYLGPFNPEPLEIKESANAWWMNRGKVYALLTGFRMGLTIKDACKWAVISSDQYKYFCEVHPEFSTIKERIDIVPIIQAMNTVNRNIDKPWVAWRLLERLDPARFGSPSERLYWAKRAVLEPTEDGDNHARNIIKSARELLVSGHSVFFRG